MPPNGGHVLGINLNCSELWGIGRIKAHSKLLQMATAALWQLAGLPSKWRTLDSSSTPSRENPANSRMTAWRSIMDGKTHSLVDGTRVGESPFDTILNDRDTPSFLKCKAMCWLIAVQGP